MCVTVLKVYSANGENTIETVDRLFNRTIGQRVQLSFIDTKLINLAYCTGQTSSTHTQRERERERRVDRYTLLMIDTSDLRSHATNSMQQSIIASKNKYIC